MTKALSRLPARPADGSSSKLLRFLVAPDASIEGISNQGRAQLLAALSLIFGGGALIALFLRPPSMIGIAAVFGISLVSYILSRTKYFDLGALVFSIGLVSYPLTSLLLGITGDFRATTAALIPISLILAGSLLTRLGYLFIGAAAAIFAFTGPLLVSNGLQPGDIRSGVLVLVTALVLYAVNIFRGSLERRQLREQQQLNRELEQIKTDLELRVDQRTAELSSQTIELAIRSQDLEIANADLQRRSSQFEAISNISRAIASIRDLETLLPQVASMIGQQFGFYHTGIFLVDEAAKYAVLRATNSEGGQRMLARGHRLQVGEQGIVGFVAATGKPRIALDVGIDAVFFNNPDLPHTHSEMALPLRSGEKVIGTLDVQSIEINAFGQEDLELLDLLADQVGLAIENARLFQDARRSLAEAESFSRQYLREGWGRLAAQQNIVGYRYDATAAQPLTQPVLLPTGDQSGPLGMSQVNTPIELRGQVIGDLVVQAPEGRRWTQDELDLIKAVADRVALSAENARLFDETSRRAERERMVSEITSKIRSSNDPGEMIQLAVQELKNALGVNRIEVIPQRVPTDSRNPDA